MIIFVDLNRKGKDGIMRIIESIRIIASNHTYHRIESYVSLNQIIRIIASNHTNEVPMPANAVLSPGTLQKRSFTYERGA